MGQKQHLTAPDPKQTKFPRGVPFIIGNELAERFSFYGMKGILVIFMTKHLLDSSGKPAFMDDEAAKAVYHLFTAGAYFFPLIGAILADVLWGKYKTILWISLMYCLGHGMLALMDLGPVYGLWDMKPFLFAGLILIAIGAGGIKPCVSAHVGDQFGQGNKHLLTQVFNWFYFSINVGAAASTLLTPVLLHVYGPWAAFGLPGVLMGLATFLFWLGRNKFVHVPAAGWESWKRETFSPEGKRALRNLAPLFLIFVPVFWALFDQTGSAWVLQAQGMDRNFAGVNWLESQIQAINPILILTFIPIFTYVFYPIMGKFFDPTPLRKIGIGMFMTVAAFGISGMIEARISGGAFDDVSANSSIASWSASRLIDGEADGYGWSSGYLDFDAEDYKAPELIIRLRERKAWTVNAVEINPYAFVGELEPVESAIEGSDGFEEYQAYEIEADRLSTLTKEERQEIEEVPDFDAMAKSVRLFVHRLGAIETIQEIDEDGKTTETEELVWDEVGIIDLEPVNRLQRLEFTSVEASKIKLVVESNQGESIIMKMGTVRVIADGNFASSAIAESDGVWPDVAALGYRPNIAWQILAYLVLTCAEILVSIVCLEFAYTQSPKKMKSFIMGIYFLGVSLGNLFVSGVNFALNNIKDAEGATPLDGATYYWFFSGLMFLASLGFLVFAKTYKGQNFIQGDDDTPAIEAESLAEGTEAR